MALETNFNYLKIKFSLKSKEHSKQYEIHYGRTTTESSTDWDIFYRVQPIVSNNIQYSVSYTRYEGELNKNYDIRYVRGRPLIEKSKRFKIKYTVKGLEDNNKEYLIGYNRYEPQPIKDRKLFFDVFYNVTGLEEYNTDYLIRYTTEPLTITNKDYTISYTRSEPQPLLSSPLLLRREDGEVDLVFRITKQSDLSVNDILFVFSNLPRFELVEIDELENKTNPHISLYKHGSTEYNTFETLFNSTGQSLVYVLIKNVEENNAVSLDLYNKLDGYKKLNEQDSYFFTLTADSFIDNNFSISNTNYVATNNVHSEYKYEYLNFVQVTATPMFRIAADCCFSRKVLKQTYTYCSPF